MSWLCLTLTVIRGDISMLPTVLAHASCKLSLKSVRLRCATSLFITASHTSLLRAIYSTLKPLPGLLRPWHNLFIYLTFATLLNEAIQLRLLAELCKRNQKTISANTTIFRASNFLLIRPGSHKMGTLQCNVYFTGTLHICKHQHRKQKPHNVLDSFPHTMI